MAQSPESSEIATKSVHDVAAGQPRDFCMTFVDSGQSIRVRSGVPLLQAMIAAGVSPVQVGCRGGGCGVCRVRVIDGSYTALAMSRSRISAADEDAGVVLACRIIPQSDMSLQPLPLDIWRGRVPGRSGNVSHKSGEK